MTPCPFNSNNFTRLTSGIALIRQRPVARIRRHWHKLCRMVRML